jgi:2Fe-2S ferredoxin
VAATYLVTFKLSSGTRSFRVLDGASLLSAALRARLPVARSCRGVAVCAACRVQVLDGTAALDPPTVAESQLAAREPLRAGERYACQARVRGPVTITTAYW